TLRGGVEVTLRGAGGAAELTVRDTGTGIPVEAQPHLFERFYRVQGAPGRTHEGSGIGLALVHELVKLHGGTVRVESEPGVGSAFTVTIPGGWEHLPTGQRVAAAEAGANGSVAAAFVAEALRWLPDGMEEMGASADASFSASTDRPRVLLADDNADMREYIARLLARECEVVAVADGQAALEAALDERPDLVLTDVMMPRLDGFGLLRAMREDAALQTVPIILLSARAGEEARVEGLEAGADDYLTKPFQTRELLAKVNGTLALARARAEAMAREAELRAERNEVLEGMNLAFMAMDADFRIVYLNPEADRLRGLTPEEYLGRIHWEAFPASNGTEVETNFRRAMTERVPVRFENFYAPWQQWFEINAYPMSGGRLGVFFREITESKCAKEAIRASAEQLRLIADTAPVFIAHCDREHRYKFVNEPYAARFGLRREEVIGRRIAEVVGEAAYASIRPHLVRVLAGEVVEFEVGIPYEKLGAHWMRCAYAPERAANGEIVGLVAVVIDITDRKQMEEELGRSEALYRAIGESIDYGVWICDRGGRNTYASESFLNLIGLTQQQCSDFGWGDRLSPEEFARTLAAWRECVRTGSNWDREHHFRGADGDWHSILARGVPVRDERGEIISWAGINLDITERKRAELELREAHDRLQTVMGSITDGLAVLDKNWCYTHFSDQAARIIGMRPEQLLGGCVWDLFPATEGTKFHEGYHRAVATGQPVEFEEYYPEPLNKWLECRCYPSAEGLSVYFHDITARKQADAVLRQNEALFSTLIEQAPLGVYVVDAQFRLQQINPIAMPAFEHVHPLIGRDFSEVMEILWGPEVGGECARVFRHTLETGERFVSPPFAAPRHDLGEERAYDWETQRVTLPDGQHGVVCYFTDVTERRRAEAALQEAKDAAETANSSKDRFLAVLSHELRTPLTPVLMAAGALEHDSELPPEVREDMAMIKRNVELETKLIDDLLDLSRITSGKMKLEIEPVDLNEAVRRVCAICRSAVHERGLRLEMSLDNAAGLVAADPARLQQMLWNVLKNAIKFTPEAGLIHISTRRLAGPRGEVRVQDSGRGIPAEVLPRVFNAFEQGHPGVTRQFGGLGLGLAICKALAELHHGSIRAESAGADLGSTFVIELPAKTPAAFSKPADPAPAENGKPRSLRLLVVEDHADTARTLNRLLRRAGFAVVSAADAASATAFAERETFDLLISDLGLPDGNGYEIMRHIRAKRGVPGIAMSGYGMEEDVRRSREAGFVEHLVKPINGPQLIAAIQRATEGRS
ncbi:MAG: PAS domain-containing protein, partial [Chthoniobacteraceae bacterium]